MKGFYQKLFYYLKNNQIENFLSNHPGSSKGSYGPYDMEKWLGQWSLLYTVFYMPKIIIFNYPILGWRSIWNYFCSSKKLRFEKDWKTRKSRKSWGQRVWGWKIRLGVGSDRIRIGREWGRKWNHWNPIFLDKRQKASSIKK